MKDAPEISSFIVGLGGKDITPDTIHKAVEMARQATSKAITWSWTRSSLESRQR